MDQIEKPNYTQIPNVVLDKWIKELSGKEFKVLCFICRKTFGWHKNKESISVRFLSESLKIPLSTLKKCLSRLRELDLIRTQENFNQWGGQLPSFYEVLVEKETPEQTPNKDKNDMSTQPASEPEGVSPVSPLIKETPIRKKPLPKGRDRDCVEFDQPDVKPKKEIKNIFGENGQVRMTQEQYDRGKNDYPPGAWDEKLEELDYYIATNKKGSNYTNHNKVIRLWLKRDGVVSSKTVKKSYDREISELRKELQKLPIESASYEEDECIVIQTLAGKWRVKKNSAFESNLKIALHEIKEAK